LTVLVIRLGAMGDILRTLPPVRLIRAALPDADIRWVVERPWDVLLDGHPDLDGVLIAPRDQWKARAGNPVRWPGLARVLHRFKRELAGLDAGLTLDFHGNLRSGLVSAWSRAPVRLGYAGHEQKEGNRWFNTHHVDSAERRTPRMERNLSLVRALGLPDAPLPGGALPLVQRGAGAAREVRQRLSIAGSRVAVVSPGASVSQAYKKPPAALLVEACRHLSAAGVRPLVVWGPGEEADAAAVVEAAAGDALMAPPTSLAALAALLARASLFVGGDTGPLHMACAVGCPVVGIYGPTDPRVNQPWGAPYRVVAPPGRAYSGIKKIDRSSGGFDGIEPNQVVAAIDALVDSRTG
jgi:ADP-heptose:LPS heptosyltransferase